MHRSMHQNDDQALLDRGSADGTKQTYVVSILDARPARDPLVSLRESTYKIKFENNAIKNKLHHFAAKEHTIHKDIIQ